VTLARDAQFAATASFACRMRRCRRFGDRLVTAAHAIFEARSPSLLPLNYPKIHCDLAFALLRCTGMAVRTCHGFTLVELLVVVGIIGILAAIAVPQYRSFRARSYDAQVESAVRNIATAQESYYTGHQTYTTSLAALEGVTLNLNVRIRMRAGNSGGIGRSFRVRARHPQAVRRFQWVSDPLPGSPNLTVF
jgi:prepilin-type N-terminal cleavage/methylation domain-containing protein